MKKFICFFIVLVVASMSACSSPSPTKITAEQAHTMMNKIDEFVIVDARTFDEFIQGHIRGAISIPHDSILYRAIDEISCKNIVVFVYCQRGRRSTIAANSLARLGFTNVYDFGGLDDWIFGSKLSLPRNSDELVVLFDDWATTESRVVGSIIMRAFQEDIVLFIEAMRHADGFSREQVLMLVGSAVAEARVNNRAIYARYIEVLDSTENLNLNDEQRRILGFIRANIDHAARKM